MFGAIWMCVWATAYELYYFSMSHEIGRQYVLLISFLSPAGSNVEVLTYLQSYYPRIDRETLLPFVKDYNDDNNDGYNISLLFY